MRKSAKILFSLYGIASFALILLGFAGLLSRRMNLAIPLVSTDIIPALQQHAVWGETLRGRAILVGGEAWFFLIVVGVVMLLGVLTTIVNRLLHK